MSEEAAEGGGAGCGVTISSELLLDDSPVHLRASGSVDVADAAALTFTLSSLSLAIPSFSAPERRPGLQSAWEQLVRTVLPQAEFKWCDGKSEISLQRNDAQVSETLLEQLYLDQDTHILRLPEGQLAVLSKMSSTEKE